MPTILAIFITVVAIAVYQMIPGFVWVGVGIAAVCIAAFVGAWFALTYLLKASIKIVMKAKD